MPFENFPYSDLHNLNMDWLLKQVKRNTELLDRTDFRQLMSDALQQAIDDGTMEELIDQQVLTDITDQLNSISGDVTDLSADSIMLERRTAAATVAMLGRPAADTDDPARGYSLCMVIYNDDACVVYDTGNDSAEYLLTYLRNHSVTKIDALIISHYHADHVTVAGVNAILASGIPVSVWYLPHGGIDWSRYTGTSYASVEASIKAAITNAGDVYVQPNYEGYPITLDGGMSLAFYNVDPALYSGYYTYLLDEDLNVTNHTNYNNFSMCCRVSCGGRMLALTGDIEEPAQVNMAPMVRGADITQLPHHGLDLRDSQAFVSSLSGKIFLTAAFGLSRYYRLQYVANTMLHHARDLGTSISTLDGNTVECLMGASGCWINTSLPGRPTPLGTFGDCIPAGADLNDYTEPGFTGYVQNADIAAQVANTPTNTGGGRLWVIASNQNSVPANDMVQIWLPGHAYINPSVFMRTRNAGTWGAWIEFMHD